MITQNLREDLYLALFALRGQHVGRHYGYMVHATEAGIPPGTLDRQLLRVFEHARRHVPFYRRAMEDAGAVEDPREYLRRLPILTKDTIRTHFDELTSDDLPERTWHMNTSGGSTGEPVRFIQDREYETRAGAVKLLFPHLVGYELGDAEIKLWGSARDAARAGESMKAHMLVGLSNTTILDAFSMTPEQMRRHLETINSVRPALITAYADAMFELARFAEHEGLPVAPQRAVITSAGTLHPFMRETIERVFRTTVYNRYGSREVGDIACERPGQQGLWVAPWGNYLEVVDAQGVPVPDGEEGEILVTCLTNLAMPLIRYRIGDRGVLAPSGDRQGTQTLEEVIGRSTDILRGVDGRLVHAGNFMVMLFFRDWIRKYQVVQKSQETIVFRLVATERPSRELQELATRTRALMGDPCRVEFEFLEDIPATASGKFRYVMNEVPSP